MSRSSTWSSRFLGSEPRKHPRPEFLACRITGSNCPTKPPLAAKPAQWLPDVSRGTFERGHLIRGYFEACRLWPAAPFPDGFDQPVQSDVPTLLISGSRDPVTPARFADEVADGLPNSLSVVVPGAGHGVAGSCVEALELQLIESGSVQGLDPSCVEAAPSPPFRLPDQDRRA